MRKGVITIQIETNNPESVNSAEIMDLVRKLIQDKNPNPILVPVVDVKWIN